MSLLGPLMWGWLATDLALKSIGTDYARVVRAVFLLAQVRGGQTMRVRASAHSVNSATHSTHSKTQP